MVEITGMHDHTYDFAQGHGLAHNPFKATIAPRPTGWVLIRSASGVRNLAPYSFFDAFNDRPADPGVREHGLEGHGQEWAAATFAMAPTTPA